MSVELASFNAITEQTSRYLTPFELEVFGNGYIEGDQITAEVVARDPSNKMLLFEANQFRREHSIFSGMPYIFEPESIVPLLKQGVKTTFEVGELDEMGHADTVLLYMMKDDQIVDDVSVFNLKLRLDKEDHIIAEHIPGGLALHPKNPVE